MKKLLAVLVLAALVGGGWYVASPWWALKNLRDAAQARDVAALQEQVDLEALRASLRDQIAGKLGSAASGTPLDSLARQVAGRVAGGALDAALTPGGVAALVTTGALASTMLPDSLRHQKLEWSVEREGLDHFRAVGRFESGAAGPVLLYERRGLGWKMVGVELP